MPEIALSQLRGADIAKARNALPPCRPDSPDTCKGAVETELGLVCVTFVKVRGQTGKKRSCFWVPESAELQR